mgnify:CR=1 FL=1
MAASEVLALRDGDRAFVADRRFYPVVFIKWWGEMNEPLVRAAFRWLDEVNAQARADGIKVVSVNDSRMSKRPPATIRKLMAELIDETGHDDALPSIVVMENPLIRGAMTAMRWLSSREWKVETTADVPAGLRRALALLAEAGVAGPRGLDPDRFEIPELPAVDTSATA